MGLDMASDRMKVLDEYRCRLPYSKKIASMSLVEVIIMESFIMKNDHMSRSDFEDSINKMFVASDRPKRWSMIMEILSCVNSGASV